MKLPPSIAVPIFNTDGYTKANHYQLTNITIHSQTLLPPLLLRNLGIFVYRIPQQNGSRSSNSNVASAVMCAVPVMVGITVPAARSDHR